MNIARKEGIAEKKSFGVEAIELNVLVATVVLIF